MEFTHDILPLRERAKIRDRWLRIRLDALIPELLGREDIDMWIIVCPRVQRRSRIAFHAARHSDVSPPPHRADLRPADPMAPSSS